MNEFFTEYPPVIKHPFTSGKFQQDKSIDWQAAEDSLQVDRTVNDVSWAIPGKIFLRLQKMIVLFSQNKN